MSAHGYEETFQASPNCDRFPVMTRHFGFRGPVPIAWRTHVEGVSDSRFRSEAGLGDVCHLVGGIDAWVKIGGPIDK